MNVPPPEFDIHSPSPDDGHEAIRVAVVEAIANLDSNRADTDDSFMLVDILFEMVEDAIAQRDAHRIRIDAVNIRCDTALDAVDDLQAKVADLTARLTALEPAVFTPEPG